MPNTINIRLLDTKQVRVENLGGENSYRIIAGEENSTIFAIISKPSQYTSAYYTVEMVNSQGYAIAETAIVNNQFTLPNGMAVAGYGQILIRAYTDYSTDPTITYTEKVPFQVIPIKVWNTLPNWKDYVSESEHVASQEWVRSQNYVDESELNSSLAGFADVIRYSSQTLTEAQQAQARNNLSALGKINVQPSSKLSDYSGIGGLFWVYGIGTFWGYIGKQGSNYYFELEQVAAGGEVNDRYTSLAGGVVSADTTFSQVISSQYLAKYALKNYVDNELAGKQDTLTFDTTPTEGSTTPVTSGGVKTAIDNAISSVYRFKGSVATYADLPSTGLTVGDVYNVLDTDKNYAWTGTAWDDIGGYIADVIRYSAQTLTTPQKKQARDNIDAIGHIELNSSTTLSEFYSTYGNIPQYVQFTNRSVCYRVCVSIVGSLASWEIENEIMNQIFTGNSVSQGGNLTFEQAMNWSTYRITYITDKDFVLTNDTTDVDYIMGND